jgi:hypothetical protein
MIVQIATLCDSAADYGGKLCVMGSFDTLCAREFPVVHPQCSLALRFTFDHHEAGRHGFSVRCLDPEGNEALPPFDPVVDVTFPSEFVPFVTRNLVLNLQRVKFERPGIYAWEVRHHNAVVMRIPLRVTLFDEGRSATGPAG